MGGGPCTPPLSPQASTASSQSEISAVSLSEGQTVFRDQEDDGQGQASLAASELQASQQQSIISKTSMALSSRAAVALLFLLVAVTASSLASVSQRPGLWRLWDGLLGSCPSAKNKSCLSRYSAETTVPTARVKTDELQARGAHLTCEQAAFGDVVNSCREVFLLNDTCKAQLSLRLTNCQLSLTERDTIACAAAPNTPPDSSVSCLASLTEEQYSLFAVYFKNCSTTCQILL